jgi:hypothetical protein
LRSAEPDSAVIIEFSARSLAFRQIQIIPLVRRKFLTMASLEVDSGNLQVSADHLDEARKLMNRWLPPESMPLDSLSVGELDIQEIGVRLDSAGQTILRCIAEGLAHTVAVTRDGSGPRLGSWMGRLRRVSYPMRGLLHEIRVSQIRFDSQRGSLYLDSLEIVPLLNRWELSRKLGYQADYVKALIPQVKISGVDWKAATEKHFRAASIRLAPGRVYVFRDRRLPRRQREQPLPMAFLRELPYFVDVDSLVLGPSLMEYEEYPAEGDHTGTLRVENLAVVMSPLLNRYGPKSPEYLHLSLGGSLMGSGEVEAQVLLPLKTGLDYGVRGDFRDLDLTRLNDPSVNLGKLRISSGLLNRLDFQFEMNGQEAHGEVVGVYHDLVIEKLRPKGTHAGEKDRLKSFFLRKVIIRHTKDESLPVAHRTGKIKYRPDPTRFVSFNLLHCLLVGVKSSFTLGFLLPG